MRDRYRSLHALLFKMDILRIFSPANRDVILHSTHTAFSKPAMYTELHQDHSLSLFFNSLQEDQAGKYTCKGTYANTVQLNKSVTIDTISKYGIREAR